MAPDFDRQSSEPQGSAAGRRHTETSPGAVRLAVRRLDAVSLSGADSLGEAVLARARGFHRREDGRRFLAGRLIARSLVAELLEVPEAAVTARSHCPDPACRFGNDGSHGEPRYFRHGQPVPLLVSFSRCGEWLAAAAAATRGDGEPGVRRLGVDVEDAASPAFEGIGLEDVMATAAEKAALAAVAEPARPRMRAQLWVRKEAVLKAAGQGLRIDPGSVGTLSGQRAGIRVYDVGPEELGLPPNLVLSCAVDTGDSAPAEVTGPAQLVAGGGPDSGFPYQLLPFSVQRL